MSVCAQMQSENSNKELFPTDNRNKFEIDLGKNISFAEI